MGFKDFYSSKDEQQMAEKNKCYDEVNEFKNSDNEDLFATGSLVYDEDADKKPRNEHHFLSMINAFKLNQ